MNDKERNAREVAQQIDLVTEAIGEAVNGLRDSGYIDGADQHAGLPYVMGAALVAAREAIHDRCDEADFLAVCRAAWTRAAKDH